MDHLAFFARGIAIQYVKTDSPRSIFTFHGPRFTLGATAYYVMNKKTAYMSIA